MLEDTNSLDGAHFVFIKVFLWWHGLSLIFFHAVLWLNESNGSTQRHNVAFSGYLMKIVIFISWYSNGKLLIIQRMISWFHYDA